MPVYYSYDLNQLVSSVKPLAKLRKLADDEISGLSPQGYSSVVSAWMNADGKEFLKPDQNVTLVRVVGVGLLTFFKSENELRDIIAEIKSKPRVLSKSERVLIRMAFRRIKKYMDQINESASIYHGGILKPIKSIADMRSELERLGTNGVFSYIVLLDIDFFKRPDITDGIVKAGYDLYVASTVMSS